MRRTRRRSLPNSLDQAARARHSDVSAFHFGSGYTSIGKRRYVFTWNRDKFPDPHARDRARLRDAEHPRSSPTSSPACSTITRPMPRSRRRARSSTTRRPARRASASSGTAEGAHVDFTHPAGVAWWQDGSRRRVARLRHRLPAGTTTTNTRSGTNTAASHGFGEPIPIERSRAAASAADDARHVRKRRRRTSRTSASTR